MAMVEEVDAHSRSLCPDEDYWIENASDSDEEYHDVKRQRIERLVRRYEAGDSLYISTARLRGPFGVDWKNPWQNRRRVANSAFRPTAAPVARTTAATDRQRLVFTRDKTPDSHLRSTVISARKKRTMRQMDRPEQDETMASPGKQESITVSHPSEPQPPKLDDVPSLSDTDNSPEKGSHADVMDLRGFQALVNQVNSISRPTVVDGLSKSCENDSSAELSNATVKGMRCSEIQLESVQQPFREQAHGFLTEYEEDYTREPGLLEAPRLDMDTSPSSAGQRSRDGPFSPEADTVVPLILLPEPDSSIKSRSVSSSFVAEEDGLTGWLDEASGFLQDWTVERELRNAHEN